MDLRDTPEEAAFREECRDFLSTHAELRPSEVDLSEWHFWPANMGEFRGRLRHERPDVALPR